jgi:hypothetical protein
MPTFTSNDNKTPAVLAQNTSDIGDAIRAEGGVGVRAITKKAGGIAVFAEGGNNNQCILATSDGGQAAEFASGNNSSPDAPPCVDIDGGGAIGLRVGSAGSFGVEAAGATAGVRAKSETTGHGVLAEANSGNAVQADSVSGSGVMATSGTGHGVDSFSDNDIGIFAQGGTFSGVFNGAFVVNKTPKLNPDPNNPAKPIDGSIVINDGNLFLNNGHIFGKETTKIFCFDVNLIGGDCAEDFDVASKENVDPGTLMVVDEEGLLRQSARPYDNRVVGVISGAGEFKPGIVLNKQQCGANRLPLALLGKVYCKVDAQYAPIEVGDLLTSSPTPGHAMRAANPLKAFGSVIGKALRRLQTGQGLIPILISLQ